MDLLDLKTKPVKKIYSYERFNRDSGGSCYFEAIMSKLKRSGSLVSGNRCFALTKLDDGVRQVKKKVYPIMKINYEKGIGSEFILFTNNLNEQFFNDLFIPLLDTKGHARSGVFQPGTLNPERLNLAKRIL
jgi:hypothetical protein